MAWFDYFCFDKRLLTKFVSWNNMVGGGWLRDYVDTIVLLKRK
jgi:hypothetical protein